MPKKKAFIDKKSAVSFRLVHRSQRDPLIAADAGPLVLAPLGGAASSLTAAQKQEEQRKFGIDYDDDYNYLQHLRDVNEVYSFGDAGGSSVQERYRLTAEGECLDAGRDLPAPSAEALAGGLGQLRLPSSVLPTEDVELRTGLLNQAAPTFDPGLDTDVLAALDDDFDFDAPENRLDDDFMAMANKPGEDLDEEDGESEEDMDSENEGSNFSGSDEGGGFDKEETRTRFSEYSVTSSVMRRSDGLQLLDQRFEKLYAQYDPEEIGDLEEAAEEAEGYSSGLQGAIQPDSDRLLAMADDFQRDKDAEKKVFALAMAAQEEVDVERARKGEADDDGPSELLQLEPPTNKRQWDCESICSTYSNLYNHPSLIREPPSKKTKAAVRIYINPKTGLPLVEPRRALGSALAELEEASVATSRRSTASTVRPKGETPEARRLRKAAVKAERKERRVEKKGNKLAFAEERVRLVKTAQNARATAGLKL